MSAESLLDRVRVAAPCSARWDDMDGDDRARFCSQCRKHVFNFSAMTRDEAEALIRSKEGSLCGRFYRRRDGRVLTTDCPVGLERRRTRLTRLCGLLFASVLLAVWSRVALRSQEQPLANRSRFFQRLDELTYEAKLKLGLVKPQWTAGAICITIPTTPGELEPQVTPPALHSEDSTQP